MEYVKLKNTDLLVSRFCMGGCPMGGYGWGETHEQNFIDAIHVALDAGVNFFDTADTYGLGQSERTLAKGLGNHRKEVIIQSKFGVKVGQGKTVIDNSPTYIREALDGTLTRLGTDYVDIYVVHYWDGLTPVEAIMDELERQRQAGKVRFFGLSNISLKDAKGWEPFKGQFTTAQYEFSLACRTHEDEIKMAANKFQTTPLTWGSLGQGVLTGKYGPDVEFGKNDRRSRDTYVNFHGDKLQQNLRIVEILKKIADSHNKTCAATAIRFILDYLPESVVIAGVKTVEQLKGNLTSMEWHLSADELFLLDRISRNAL